MMTTVTARDFNRDVSAAKRAAHSGPVFVTDRGEPAFVLLDISEYRRLTSDNQSLVDALRMDDDIDFDDFEPMNFVPQVPDL